GDVQGRPGSTSLGDRSSALKSYQKSLAIYEKLRDRDHSTVRQIAILQLRIGDVQQFLNSANALASYHKALQVAESVPEIARREIAMSHQRIGLMMARTGDLGGAMQHLRLASTMFEQVAAAVSPSDPIPWCETQRDLSITTIKYGDLFLA